MSMKRVPETLAGSPAEKTARGHSEAGQSPEVPDSKRRLTMGRETKIGVSVILILLCVLAGVVAMRMTRSKQKNLVAAITTPEPPRPEARPEPPRPSPTTLLPAGDTKPSGWTVASDSKPTMPPPKPPVASFMPDPTLAGSRPMHHRPLGQMPPANAPASNPLTASTPPSPPAPPTPPAVAAAPPRPALPPMSGPGPGDPRPLGGATTLNIAVGQAGPPSAEPGTRYPLGPPPTTYASGRHTYGGPPEPTPAMRTVSLPVGGDPIPDRRPVERVQPGGSYKVQPGDNYWKISEKLYGNGAYFKALAEHNRDRNLRDDRLLPGATLSAPEVSELEQKYADLCPKASHRRPPGARFAQVNAGGRLAGRPTYRVSAGDTLYDIAKHELGNPARWGEIYQLNREVLGEDYDYLSPGLELVLPEGPRRDSLTRRPEEGLRR
jgi:nucleoid-associated protein YgaU